MIQIKILKYLTTDFMCCEFGTVWCGEAARTGKVFSINMTLTPVRLVYQYNIILITRY